MQTFAHARALLKPQHFEKATEQVLKNREQMVEFLEENDLLNLYLDSRSELILTGAVKIMQDEASETSQSSLNF